MSKDSKTAIVTGGARGIGLSYVEALINEGFKVAILDLQDAIAKADELNKKYGKNVALGYQCDVSDKINFRDSFDLAWKDLLHESSSTSTIDCLVLNAGIFGSLFNKAEKIVQVNLLHVIYGAEMAIKASTKSLTQPSPKPLLIAITSSSNGLIPADSDLAPVYVSTKFGINGFIYSLRPLCARFNIRVNGIAPVTVRTPMVEEFGLSPEVISFLESENRGGVLETSSVSNALIHV